ncbi:sporulation peptidase YabG [Heliorestis acidaminivorans]|uniref:Sporulation peptidase YabG n=1 Tax=Heliorestis acidaminivorans TaxID=553427 RepID=A0A6I0F3I8_9FIRM|nr:sporulation peptidase YabG [Heliorestis acidaminivorans]KAB2953021.1 sporulation peptidase YabG [Heliorestis acidaminivorans]
MEERRVGTIVTRNSYGNDIFFRIVAIRPGEEEPEALLEGLDMRLQADAPCSDLDEPPLLEIFRYKQRLLVRHHKQISQLLQEHHAKGLLKGKSEQEVFTWPAQAKPGTVLHIDGNEEYLNLCMDTYKQLQIEAVGIHGKEEDFPKVVSEQLKQKNFDILVITGHDSLLKNNCDKESVDSYRSSRYFVDAVREARKIIPDQEELVIFAGACQSYYEAIVDAGANFATSPERVMIHALDPVFIAEKIAYTPREEYVEVKAVVDGTITGAEGIGGIDTKGCYG